MREAVAGVKGGVIPFRGNGAAARRYVEVERWPLGGHYPHLAEPVLFVRRLSHLLSSIHQ